MGPWNYGVLARPGLQLQGLHLRKDGGGGPGRFRRLMRRIEQLEALDPAVRAAEPPAGRLVENPRMRSFLHGDATGIPLHGILTDVPFGAWFMAMYLDLFPDAGTQRAATRLVGLGVLAAAPTALTGWAEWALAGRATKRVGIVHAGLNGVAVLIFLGSWTARRRGRHQARRPAGTGRGTPVDCGRFPGRLHGQRPPGCLGLPATSWDGQGSAEDQELVMLRPVAGAWAGLGAPVPSGHVTNSSHPRLNGRRSAAARRHFDG